MGHALGNNYGKFYSFQNKPVLLDLQFTVDATNGKGVSAISGQGVQNVFMHTSTTPSGGNPNPASGYALIQLEYNYTRVYGGPWNVLPPLTGSNLAINGSALTAGIPYQITDVGHSEAGTATVITRADSSGDLASTYFTLFDNYGNTFIIWFSVDGVGSAPLLGTAAPYGTMGLHYVQQSIATGATNAQVADALVLTIQNLPSGVSGVLSFTASNSGHTVTVVSTQHSPYMPLPGVPADGISPLNTGFTLALTKYTSNLQDWQAVGLPKGINPAVGASFIATATGYSTGGGSTGTVKAFGSSGVVGMDILGNPNLSIFPVTMGGSPNVGGWILLRFLTPTFAGSALSTHTHDLKIIGGQAAAGTDAVSAKTLTLGKEAATDITIAGANSATLGGVVAVSGGTPAGSITYGAGAPTAGTQFYMQFLLEQGARVGGNGE